jgi:hypothetical protein
MQVFDSFSDVFIGFQDGCPRHARRYRRNRRYPTVMAAKAATAAIPIVFAMGSDPVASGVVTSLNQPGGNVTGVSFFAVPLGSKRLALLRDFVPSATATSTNGGPPLLEGSHTDWARQASL